MSKKTTEIIIKHGCNYIIGLKKNQLSLYKNVQQTMNKDENYSSWDIAIERSKGRIEIRIVSVSDKLDGIDAGWIGLKQVIKIERFVMGKKRKSTEVAYYISSKQSDASEYIEGIRNHWAIENGLHYVKDVIMREDYSKIYHAAQNMSVIRSIVLNIMRRNKYQSVVSATRLLANDIAKLKKIIL